MSCDRLFRVGGIVLAVLLLSTSATQATTSYFDSIDGTDGYLWSNTSFWWSAAGGGSSSGQPYPGSGGNPDSTSQVYYLGCNGQTGVTDLDVINPLGQWYLAGVSTSYGKVYSSSGRYIDAGSADVTFTVDGARTLDVTVAIQGGNGIIKNGTGTLNLSGANTYGGNTAVSVGTLIAQTPPALPGYTTTRLSVAGGATVMVGSAWASGDIDNLRANTAAFTAGSGIGIDTTGGNYSYASNISDINGQTHFAKLGGNGLTLTGTNTYSGNTTVFGGTLSVPTTASLPNFATKLSVKQGAMLAIPVNGSGWSLTDVANLLGNPAGFAPGSYLAIDTTAGNLNYASNITNSGLLFQKDGPNTLTLAGFNPGAYSSGQRGIVINAGTLTLAGSNSFNNYVYLNAGQLNLNHAGALLGPGVIQELFVYGGTTIDNTSGAGIALTSNRPWQWRGSFTFGGSYDLSMGTGTVNTSVAASTVAVTVNGSNLTVGGRISGTKSIEKTGPGTLTLANYGTASNYGATGTGGTKTNTTVTAGTLVAKTPGSLSAYATAGELSVANSATLAVGVGGTGQWTSANVDSLKNNTTAWVSGSTLGFDTTGGSFSYASNITNAGLRILKLGANKLALTGTNSYTGLTIVNGGILELGVNAQSQPLNAAYGADVISGKLVFDYSGSTILPTVQSAVNAGTIYRPSTNPPLICIDNPSSAVTVQSTLYGDSNLDGSVDGTDLNTVLSNYNATGANWLQGDFNYDGTVDGTDLNTVLSNYNQVVSAAAAVPEPTSLLLVTAGCLGLAAYAWRKRK
jgi:fibronectin-binding autotransporter adhesin